MNAVITTDTDNIIVQFNDLAGDGIPVTGVWAKDNIGSIQNFGDQILVQFSISKRDWYISRTSDVTGGTILIDSIDGVTPSDNLDLYEKIVFAIKGITL